MERFLCIHGHFYQPPRENPWLEAVELQDSAAPFHDWNERVTAQCYAPNAVARILDGDRWIERIVNNYARISFNFGPTLLSWLQASAPETYAAILAADKDSAQRFGGHGSAMAQAYNHMILPLAHPRDKDTQVAWGIRDFESRFGRQPEGMWLAETAVDVATLEALAARGIAFTVLAPHQAHRFRRIGDEAWSEPGAAIDPSMAYRQELPSGRSIALFFYDGPISRAVAFEKLLETGERLAQRLTAAFADERGHPQLVHIATDGESYGHHHPHGDMGLAYALELMDRDPSVQLTNYAEFLERHPPAFQVEIAENTSWSCAHGIERWRSDCGCNSGGHEGWRQAWRAPLREALDGLRDAVAQRFEEHACKLLNDPWAARNDYIDVVLDRSPESVAKFFRKHGRGTLDAAQTRTALKLLELQRHAMLMYTSCGWFFDELSGIETVQVLQYAGRVLHLARELFPEELESGFLAALERAPSNLQEHGNGRQIFEKWVRPAMVDVTKVGAHYAISSLFSDRPASTQVYCYTADREDLQVFTSGKARLAVGRVRIASQITGDELHLMFGVVHAGDHHLSCHVREYREPQAYESLLADLKGPFARGDIHETMQLVDQHLDGATFSLRSLFRDEQRRILDVIMDANLVQVAGAYRQVHESNASLLRFLADIAVPFPRSLHAAADLSLNAAVMDLLADDRPDPDRLAPILDEARILGVRLDQSRLRRAAQLAVDRTAAVLFDGPPDAERLQTLRLTVEAVSALPFPTELWRVQNGCHDLLRDAFPEFRERAEAGDEAARTWVDRFSDLASLLRLRVPVTEGACARPAPVPA